MKKKLMFLLLGVVAVCSGAFSQINVTTANNGGFATATGTVTNVNAGAQLSIGSTVTFVLAGSSNLYTFTVIVTPSSNPGTGSPTPALISNAISNAFNSTGVTGPPGIMFGSNVTTGDYALQFVSQTRIPLDFGLVGVLCGGAFIAVASARRRKMGLIA